MRQPDRHPCFRVRLAAALVLVHLLAVLALAASPHLHHWVHPDADDDDHDCAVVLFMHGGGNAAPAPLLVPGFVASLVTADPAALPSATSVSSVFAASSVLEHAPPTAC